MKYLDEYRDAAEARRLAAALARLATRPWTIMEVCGGQTHSIVRFGLDELLPPGVTLVHGPGCPVCVTPAGLIDQALELAARPEVILCSFGDMLRVPGSESDLLAAKAAGGDVRMVYSPFDALAAARANPGREVVFFAVGFETTAPATAMAVRQARREGLANFSLLVSHVLVTPAMEAVLESPLNRVQGFLAAGHACAVTGLEEYLPLVRRHRVPVVVTGFEPLDILQGVYLCVKQLEEGRFEVENQYARAVRPEGNREAQRVLREVYEVVARGWRGLGEIARSGLRLRREFAGFDAERRFALRERPGAENPDCRAGLVLQGRMTPDECPAFGTGCTPGRPLGAPMVSSEGACAAWHRYRRHAVAREA